MRNFNIDLLRIIFAVIIVYAHMGLVKLVPTVMAGPILVFFFVLTGYFTMSGYEKRKATGQSFGSFMLQKVMSFLPYLIAAAVVTGVLQTYLQMDYYGYTLGESLITTVLTFFADISCLSMFGMPFIMGNVAVWYLSGMVVGLLVTYPFVMKFGHSFSKYAAPFIGIFCIATALRLTGTLFGPYEDLGGVTKGFFESVGMICLGYFAFECQSRFKEIKFTKLGKRLMQVIELAFYIIPIVMILFQSYIYTGHLVGHLSLQWYELLATVMIFIALVLTCSGNTSLAFDVTDRPRLKKLSSFLAVSSLVLYLSNYYQVYYVSKMMKHESVSDIIISVVILVVISYVCVYVGGELLKRAGKGLKPKLIVQDEQAA